MEKIFENLMKVYERTGKIGRVKPFNNKHAQKIAYAVACSIIERSK